MTKAEQVRRTAWRFKVLQQACEQSRNVSRTCRHFGISRQAFYRWKRLDRLKLDYNVAPHAPAEPRSAARQSRRHESRWRGQQLNRVAG